MNPLSPKINDVIDGLERVKDMCEHNGYETSRERVICAIEMLEVLKK